MQKAKSIGALPNAFTSPPLLPGLLNSVQDVIGADATPTPIQALSLKWLFDQRISYASTADPQSTSATPEWRQFLLASETGSGKTLAYLLPMLQDLKQAELRGEWPRETPGPRRALDPRALVLAPTHELARQLAGSAKSLLHEVKLRVSCASRANTASSPRPAEVEIDDVDGAGEFEVRQSQRSGHPVDVLVGTPMKVLEMARGRGWELLREQEQEQIRGRDKIRRGKSLAGVVGTGSLKWRRGRPELGLANVEWVVIDEADVLLGKSVRPTLFHIADGLVDPDFQESTQALLADIAAARGHPVPVIPASAANGNIPYPFNLVLSSATIPASLADYLNTNHPHLTRLVSPRLHSLPRSLHTEHTAWTGGSKAADVVRRLREVWDSDYRQGAFADGNSNALSRVLVFVNRSTRAEALGQELTERGIANIILTSTSATRRRGSNHHLAGFLRGTASPITSENPLPAIEGPRTRAIPAPPGHGAPASEYKKAPAPVNPIATIPHVMITTSLLSRGLDFGANVRHVFMVDASTLR